jgi:hypothetical protein
MFCQHRLLGCDGVVGRIVRDDLRRAREAIAEKKRLQALFDLIARGRPAMAQGGLVAAGG